MKIKYLFGLIILIGLISCEKETVTDEYIPSDLETTTRSTSSAIPFVNDLADIVIDLEDEGQISKPTKNKILYELSKAKDKLEEDNAIQAIKRLKSLIYYIKKKVNQGQISSDVGDMLIDLIYGIIDEIYAIDNDGDGYSVNQDCDDNNEILHPGNTSGLAVFAEIDMETIMSQDLNTTPINGDNNASNLLTPGAIILYKTDQGRFGKMIILSYGYNLSVKFITYDYNGSIFSSASNFGISGTWSVDLDAAAQNISNDSDIYWEQETYIERQLTPLDNVTITLFSCM